MSSKLFLYVQILDILIYELRVIYILQVAVSFYWFYVLLFDFFIIFMVFILFLAIINSIFRKEYKDHTELSCPLE